MNPEPSPDFQIRKSTFNIHNLVIGTRGSALAQWQTDFVVAALQGLAPDLHIERRIIKTAGDKDQTRPLAEIGGLGVFTKEIENALLAREIDVAVHSLKDLPTETAPGLTIAAIMEREDPRDCLVSRHRLRLMELPRGARIGTSSARRGAQVLALRSDVTIVPLRGNVDTRLRKAQSEEYDAIVIAAAGLIRLGRANEITQYLPTELVLPDPGQGAMAVEIRSDDLELAALVSRLDHPATRAAATAERAFLLALGGGCRMPIGAYAGVAAGQVHLRGMVASLDGRRIVRGEQTGDAAIAAQLGSELAGRLLADGGAEILILGNANHDDGAAPLRGRRIVVTRAAEQAGALSAKITALGGEPVEFPVIGYAPLEDARELDQAIRRASEFDWVVFTSANGVRAVSERLDAIGLPTAALGKTRLAAIGPATASALAELGLAVDFVPTKFLGEQVAAELPITPGETVLLLRADIASEALARGLEARGARVTDVDAYRTIKPDSPDLDLGNVDAVTFTSSSTVRNLCSMLSRDQRNALEQVAVFCIGPVTAETAHELGLNVTSIAGEHTVDGLVDAMIEYYREAEDTRNAARKS